jgi:hypothetical protein
VPQGPPQLLQSKHSKSPLLLSHKVWVKRQRSSVNALYGFVTDGDEELGERVQKLTPILVVPKIR